MARRLTRRDFVKAAGAAAAMPAIIPASALGRQGKTPPSERITIGVIGTGYQARGHIDLLIRHPDVKVLAVCDVDRTRREHAKKMVEDWYSEDSSIGAHKGCDAYVDFRDITNRADIDAVLIATPDHWHCIPAVEAMKHGKDVYCEKPLTLTIAEGKTLIDVARRHRRVFQVGSQQRSGSEFRVACEAVRNGRIGKVRQVYVSVGGPSRPCDLGEEPMEPGLDWDRWLGPAPMRPYNSVLSPRGVHSHFPDWRSYQEYSGGGMTDWGAHHFDIAQWGLGMDQSGPVEIIPPDDKAAGIGVRYLYANGVEVIHGDWTTPDGNRIGGVNFVGENGSVHVNRGELQSWPNRIVKDPLGAGEKPLYKSPGHHQDWFDCIRNRQRPICDVEIGARSVTVCHLGNLAYWHDRKLRWDPARWRFVGDREADSWRSRDRRAPWDRWRA
ncbi:MAG: Gfo/Idh/MocA family oxidoreductase [Chthonomonadales bacterium]|nr:Gfo/Idh/MocA family oxidoreductase [Chthonomonadales bacterium]